MCLAFIKKANVEFPRTDLEAAVHHNQDGWGLSVALGDGELLTLRSGATADVDNLYRLINEEYKEHTILGHLRFTTAGDTSTRNAHPFPVLELGTHGEDVRMVHNGTINKWRSSVLRKSWESDTRVFTREFVRPLFARMNKGFYTEELFKDEFIQSVLSDQIPTGSVLAFLNGDGDHMIINERGNGGGWVKEGLYYSNSYSVRPVYKPTTTYVPPTLPKAKPLNTFTLGDKVKTSGNRSGYLTDIDYDAGWAEFITEEGDECSTLITALSLVKKGAVAISKSTREKYLDDKIENLDPITSVSMEEDEIEILLEHDAMSYVGKLLDIIVELQYTAASKENSAKEKALAA